MGTSSRSCTFRERHYITLCYIGRISMLLAEVFPFSTFEFLAVLRTLRDQAEKKCIRVPAEQRLRDHKNSAVLLHYGPDEIDCTALQSSSCVPTFRSLRLTAAENDSTSKAEFSVRVKPDLELVTSMLRVDTKELLLYYNQ